MGAGAASLFFDNPHGHAAPQRQSFLKDFPPIPSPLPLPGDGSREDQDPIRFARFAVKDELTIPEGYKAERLLMWGEKLGTNNTSFSFGYNCDHISLLKRDGTKQNNTEDEYFLVVNHEYVSVRPWTDSYEQIFGERLPDLHFSQTDTMSSIRLGDMVFPLLPGRKIQQYKEFAHALETLAEKMLEEMGVSVVHAKRINGQLRVLHSSDKNFRISGQSSKNIPSSARFRFAGPGSSKLSRPKGTLSNCSGATTPWNTALTCEENFQDVMQEWVTPQGEQIETPSFSIDANSPNKRGIPLEWRGLGTCLKEPLDGRLYGWVAEIRPETGDLIKYTSLGRFRHENVTISARPGERLRCYMGDDRRGGHIWKFVSDETITDPRLEETAALLEKGTLYCAQFYKDYSGIWIPLALKTRVAKPNPNQVAEGYILLPDRPRGGAVAVSLRAKDEVSKLLGETLEIITPDEWTTRIESFAGKPFEQVTLGDLVNGQSDEDRLLVLLMDAFLMGNACGATPTARPEDLEIHPFDRSIYIAFTDNSGKEEGSPDVAIFPDSKRLNSRQYGAIYRIEEGKSDSEFQWGKFLSSGEVAESGAGFACVDNLAFDRDGNLWFVSDIQTYIQNHKVNGAPNELPGTRFFPGIFGNSALFVVPTSGSSRGIPLLFATGPMECELTGIKFYEDENFEEFLLLSVQHPGEENGIGLGAQEEREITLRTRAGREFTQRRTVPIGSNFPLGGKNPPRPSIYALYRCR